MKYLKNSPAVKEVLYTEKGGMISFKVVEEEKIPHIINNLQIITFCRKSCGVESLITYPRAQTHADIPEDARLSYGLTNDLLRLSIGIEDVEDLIDDLKNALRDSMGKYDFTTRPNRLNNLLTNGRVQKTILICFQLRWQIWISCQFQKSNKLSLIMVKSIFLVIIILKHLFTKLLIGKKRARL